MLAWTQRFWSTCFILMLAGSLTSAGENHPFGELESRIPRVMQAHHVPGLSIVLIRDNQIAWAKAFGVRVAGQPEKVDTETVFEAASMSKPMFSYAVFKLVEKELFDLDRPLDEYLPAPYLADRRFANRINGRMVMLHRTGLPNWREGSWRNDDPLLLKCEPDSRFTYSGEGFLYLQRAVEQITRKPVAEWMQVRLLDPLKMHRSSYRWHAHFASNVAGGHDKNGRFEENRRFYREGNAAFSLYTTPSDYARFLIEIMKLDRSAPYSVKSKLLEEMTTLQVECEQGDPKSRRSLGWIVDAPEDGGYVRHTGTNGAGFHCVSRFAPDRGAGCVIMSNHVGAKQALREILAIIDSTSAGGDPVESRNSAKEVTCWNPRSYTARYEYRVMNPTTKAATRVEIHVPLPVNTPRQEVHYLLLPDITPEEIVTDRHGQRLAHYLLDALSPGESIDLGYVVGVTLRNMQWADPGSRSQAAVSLSPELRRLYLRPETNYSMDSELMRGTAAAIIDGATTDFEKIERIHAHVIRSIRYVRDDRWDPAAVVLKRGTGSCSEYNYVFSGLCRLAGLPTRCAGGSSNGFRQLPTTDTVFHRWTEVFLSNYGWFPVDCSRDANPIRGRRSHFGRLYTDALVWCHQAGGEEDTLGWDYRGHARVKGEDPGIREDHRVRWFSFSPKSDVRSARTWFREGGDAVPSPDLLECALLDWDRNTSVNRVKMVDALAKAGRAEAIRRVAMLPSADSGRCDCLKRICTTPDLAQTIFAKSDDSWAFRNWFKARESQLKLNEAGRFELDTNTSKSPLAATTASAPDVWTELAEDAAQRLAQTLDHSVTTALTVAPLVDYTGSRVISSMDILAPLRKLLMATPGVRLINATRFNDWLAEHGPGRGEYWVLANGDYSLPSELLPHTVIVPVAILSRGEGYAEYRLDLKRLELETCQYTTISAKRRRVAKRKSAVCGSLIAAGDTMPARWEHDLVGRHGYEWPLIGVANAIRSADVALCNLECCVSLRGKPADKGERCPFYYRARPEMLHCLTVAGIDIVTAANNHSGDYGPGSVTDTVKWCRTAGLACVGVGKTAHDAEMPCVMSVGPVRVAIAGIDATKPHFAADADSPGTNFAPEDESLEVFTAKVRRFGEWARGRCDLLAMTIHWGPNWENSPSPTRRRMARIAFDHGIDLILGHSAHRLQGIEVIDGKPVLYDMGNLLFDCDLAPEGRRSALFRLSLSARGVRKIEIIPTQALLGHTVFADAVEAHGVLREMKLLCSDLGVEAIIDEDIQGRPIGVIAISEPKATPRIKLEVGAQCAKSAPKQDDLPTCVDESNLRARIPNDAVSLSTPVCLAPGLQLLAYRLPETAVEGGVLRVSTWWRVNSPIDRNVLLAFLLKPNEQETPRRGTPWYTRHDAGDWTVPLHRVRPGTIIEDEYPCRLAGLPAGLCKVYAVALDSTKPPDACVLGEPQLLDEVLIQP